VTSGKKKAILGEINNKQTAKTKHQQNEKQALNKNHLNQINEEIMAFSVCVTP
jgi:hypothetical protein